MNLPIIAILLLAPITVFIYMFSLWKKYGKNEEPKNVVMQSEPPKKITPAMAGYVFGNKFTSKIIPAMIIEMATNKFIELEVLEKRNKIVKVKNNTKLEKNKECEDFINSLQKILEDKKNEEQETKRYLNISFKFFLLLIMLILSIAVFMFLNYSSISNDTVLNTTTIPLIKTILVMGSVSLVVIGGMLFFVLSFINLIKKDSKIKNVLDSEKSDILKNKNKTFFDNWYGIYYPHSFVSKITKKIKEDMSIYYNKKIFEKNISYRILKLYSFIVLCIFMFEFAYSVKVLSMHNDLSELVIFSQTELVLLIMSAFLLPVFIFYIFDHYMSKRNSQGAEIYRQLLGFKKYLSAKEKLNSREATQEIFEKYFPYAIALGVKNEWADRFTQTQITIPKWFIAKDENGNLVNSNINGSVEIAKKIYSAIASSFAVDEQALAETEYFNEKLGKYKIKNRR